MPELLNQSEQSLLLTIAREALDHAVRGEPLPTIPLESLPAPLLEQGASFVTLTSAGKLRGCIGTLEAYQPLAVDVQTHAVAAALQDYRFPRVQPAELSNIVVEISVLTPRQRLTYRDPAELLAKLKPGIDGVVISDGSRTATFLPQVWQQLPDPADFLSHLCQKMGASADLWRKSVLEVSLYQVQEFQENNNL